MANIYESYARDANHASWGLSRTPTFDGYLDLSSFKVVGADEAYAIAMEPDMDTLDTLLGEMTMEEAIADMRKTVNGIPEERA